MREHKYRAWNKNTLQMLYTDWNSFRNWYDLPTGGHVMYGRGFDGEKIILSEPMQYTDKKDKRNVEIYDGDILKFLYLDENKKVMPASGIYLIEWSDEVCGFICERQEPYNYLLSGIWHECEIVGNIYENPELKEVEKR